MEHFRRKRVRQMSFGRHMELLRRKCVREKSFGKPYGAFSKEMYSSEVVWESIWSSLERNVFGRSCLGSTWSILKGNVFVRCRLGVHMEHFKRKCVRERSFGSPHGAFPKEVYSSEVVWGLIWTIFEGNVFVRGRLVQTIFLRIFTFFS